MRVMQICRVYSIVKLQFSEVSNGFTVTLFKEKRIRKFSDFNKENVIEI